MTSVGTPKAGVFAEGAAQIVAQRIIAEVQGSEPPPPFDGIGACFIEFGGSQVGRVEVNFLSVPKPTGSFDEPSQQMVADKAEFATSRYARRFGH